MAEQEQPPRAIRYAEKRQTSTCRFADRVAQVSVDSYHSIIPGFYREQQKQTCVATIVAHDTSLPNENNNNLIVLAMGVGTKFLSRTILEQEHNKGCRYGQRVRDCHAEVLARRAFRRRLSLEILRDLQRNQEEDEESKNVASRGAQDFKILQRCCTNGSGKLPYYQLRPEVSLHFYSSSAPCGNAVLKKFASLRKERFRQDLAADEWPLEKHLPIAGHAVPSGEFALLVKMENNQQLNIPLQEKEGNGDEGDSASHCQDSRWTLGHLSNKQRQWPVHTKTDWCPPGTTTVWSGQGSIHTCSDKLCRWNLFGLQGSLLSSLFCPNMDNEDRHLALANDDDPPSKIHMNAKTNGWPVLSTLTVGRKLNAVTCRRAVCCRFEPGDSKSDEKNPRGKKRQRDSAGVGWQVNHPTILGTSVYLDEYGVVETSAISGQDVRFHSALCWAWWLDDESGDKADSFCSLDCIDGTSGWAIPVQEAQSGSTCWGSDRTFESDASDEKVCSRVSTAALLDLFQEIDHCRKAQDDQSNSILFASSLSTLGEIRSLKRRVSSTYEKNKETILTKHPVFCQWNRREYEL